MRKLLFAFSALALLFTSCSSDGDSSSDTTSGTVLVKRTIESDSEGYSVTNNFAYNGNKLVSVINNLADESDMYVTYTGDLITKIEWKLDGVVEQTDSYEYNAEGKLATFVRLDPGMDWGNKEVYTYNGDGTVSYSHYIGDMIVQDQLNHTGKIFFLNGEISSMERYENGVTTSTTTYTHDTANGAMKNIAGWSKIAFADGEADSMLHNILTSVSSTQGTTTTTYTYNSNNYPVTANEAEGSGYVYTTQFFYE